jgi:hypothetical protein
MTAEGFAPLQRLGRSEKILYAHPKLLKQKSAPFVLTYWSSEELIVALPSLLCRPKIVRIPLPIAARDNDYSFSPIRTLTAPIYFPSSTPYRNPQIALLSTPSRNSNQLSTTDFEHLVLVLDSYSPPAKDNHEMDSSLPPIAMAWDITDRGGWREWDKDVDEHSQDMGLDTHMCQMLRGSFVDSEQRFCVPIRSGLDFTRQAFVSC